MFELHPRLRQDCFEIGFFELSCLLLMNDCRYPWFILVPAREGISEIHQLTEVDQMALLRESCALAKGLQAAFDAHKMNIAALGNQVSQLHLHHIVRYRHDQAWPAPVWGRGDASPYTETARRSCIAAVGRMNVAGLTLMDV